MNAALSQMLMNGVSSRRLRSWLEENGRHVAHSSDYQHVESAIARLPRKWADSDPYLLYLQGVVMARRGQEDRSRAFLERALALVPRDPCKRTLYALIFGAKSARMIWAADSSEFGTLLELSRDPLVDADVRAGICAGAAVMAVYEERYPLVNELVDEAVRLLNSGSPATTQCSVFGAAAVTAVLTARFKRARIFAQRQLGVARQHAFPAYMIQAYSVLFCVACELDDNSAAAASYARLWREQAQRLKNAMLEAMALCATIFLCAEQGDLEELDALERVLDARPVRRDAHLAPTLYPALALQHAWGGRFSQAYGLMVEPDLQIEGRARRGLHCALAAVFAAAADRDADAESAVLEARQSLRLRAPVSPLRHALTRTLLTLALSLSMRTVEARRELARVVTSDLKRYSMLHGAVRAYLEAAVGASDWENVDLACHALANSGLAGYAKLLYALPARSVDQVFCALTSEERELLAELARNEISKTIAKKWKTRKHVIDRKIERICKKLRVPTRKAAVRLALEHHVVSAGAGR